jgi:hypothetical protein
MGILGVSVIPTMLFISWLGSLIELIEIACEGLLSRLDLTPTLGYVDTSRGVYLAPGAIERWLDMRSASHWFEMALVWSKVRGYNRTSFGQETNESWPIADRITRRPTGLSTPLS